MRWGALRRLPASPADLAGARRESWAGDGAEFERAGVARARLRCPERAAVRPWRRLRRARVAMGLLRLVVLAALAAQPGVAGGAETVGNSSVGKVRVAPFLQPKQLFAFLARSKSTSGYIHLAGEVQSSEPSGTDQSPFLQKAVPFAKEAS